MIQRDEIIGWLEDAPGRLRPLWILRGVSGNEICHGHVARNLTVFEGGGVLRLGWCDGGLHGRDRGPRLQDALIHDGQLRVAVFGGEYDVLPFNIENALEMGIPEASGMTPWDDEQEAQVAYPYGFGDT